MTDRFAALLLALPSALAACAATSPRGEPPTSPPSHGLQVGEVPEDRALIFARGERAGHPHVEVRDVDGRAVASASAAVDAAGRLSLEVVDGHGRTVFTESFRR